MSLHHQVRAQAVAHPRRWTALVLLCLAEFMLILDATAANVALPRIGADLSMGRTALTWVVTAYVLAFGGLMLLGGRLADTLGRRRVLLAGIVLFTLGSLACGLTGSGALLIAARVAQGVGAALVAPAALSTITTMFTGAERNKALGVWAAIGGSGFVVGMIVSGVLTAGPGWRWVFFVNVPVGLLALVVLPMVLPAEPVDRPDRPRRSDRARRARRVAVGRRAGRRRRRRARHGRRGPAGLRPHRGRRTGGPRPARCCRSPPLSRSPPRSSASSAGWRTR